MSTKYMQYELGGHKRSKSLIKDKWVAKNVKDIDKLSSGRILVYLYKRHELFILQVAVVVIFTWAIVSNVR